MKNYKRFVLVLILAILFLSPLHWFSDDAFDSNGDDHNLQFFAPENYLSTFSVYSWGSYSGLSIARPPNPTYFFMIFPLILKKAGFSPGQIIKIFYGIILSLNFIFTYFFTKELLMKSNIGKTPRFWGAVCAGLMFALSPLVAYSIWTARLSTTLFALFLFPALLYYFLLAVHRRNTMYLMIGSILLSIFSFAIYVPIPWACAFLIGIFIFIITYYIFYPLARKCILKYSLIYSLYILLLNLPWILLLIHLTFLTKDIYLVSIVSISEIVKSSVGFVESISVYFNPFYYFILLPPKEFVDLGHMYKSLFYYKYLYIFFPFPLLITIGYTLAKEEKRKLILIVLIPAIAVLYLLTVNITALGVRLFSFMVENIPFFAMFRNFYSKFPPVFSFFYSVTLGISISITLFKVKQLLLRSIIISLLILIIFSAGFPLLSGKIIGEPKSIRNHERSCPKIPESHFKALEVIKADDNCSRVLIFPLSFASYMCFKGDDEGHYVGVPFIKVLAGHDEFGGIWSFHTAASPSLAKNVSNLISDYDFKKFKNILWAFNVDKIYLYENLSVESSQTFIFKYNYIDKMKSEFVKSLCDKKIADFGGVQIYEIGYSQKSSHVMAEGCIMQVDDIDWLSKLLYSNYFDEKNKPVIIYKKK